MNSIALDMDGCVSNFAKAFSTLCNNLDNRAPVLKDSLDVKDHNWHSWYATSDVLESAWDRVKGGWGEGKGFWLTLEPAFPLNYLRKIYKEKPIVFITRRDGDSSWDDTVKWLKYNGIEEPLVYRTISGEEKVDVCKRMGINILIEDDPKNIHLALAAGMSVIMILYPYNVQVSEHPNLYTESSLTRALKTAEEIK